MFTLNYGNAMVLYFYRVSFTLKSGCNAFHLYILCLDCVTLCMKTLPVCVYLHKMDINAYLSHWLFYGTSNYGRQIFPMIHFKIYIVCVSKYVSSIR